MFAAIYIPDFPVEALVRLKPELRERAVAVLEGTAPLLRVVAVNDRASDAGLEPGMTKLQAEELAAACHAVLAMRSPEQEASAQAALLDAACGFSPRVEDTAPGLVVIDLDGLDRIFGPAPKLARDLARRCSDIGLEAQIAVAANPEAAIHAARGFSGVTVIPAGREAERLATLPVDVLTVTQAKNSPQRAQRSQRPSEMNSPVSSVSPVVNSFSELLNTLESWGVRNLRSLAALPEVAVSERLGQPGLHWQRLARGATSRALKLVDPPARFEETCELDYPLESLEPLSFLLNRMLDQLCARLSARALATNELRIRLTLDPVEDVDLCSTRAPVGNDNLQFEICNLQNKAEPLPPENCQLQITNYKSAQPQLFTRSLHLPVPMLDAKVFLKLLQLDLQSHPPGAPVVKISIEACAAEPRHTQNGLFEAGAPEPERLELTLARIGAIVERAATEEKDPSSSVPRAGSAELLDTHRPDAFRVHHFSTAPGRSAAGLPATSDHRPATNVTALRLFRPPLPAQVMVRAGKPARMQCETMTGEISWAAGPWRSSGEWWTEHAWAREEWDVCVGQACYRIYREQKGWFVEGSYD